MLCLIIISCSDQEIKQKLYIQPIDIQSKNPKAIEFYREAKLKLFNGEQIEAKQGFLSALRLDPNFFMANTDINEDNIKLKQSFNAKARNLIQNSNEFEKLYFNYVINPSRYKKREIAIQIKELYPDNYEGYIMEGLTHFWWLIDTNEAQNLFKKAIEIDPNNLTANFNYVEYKYNGAPKAFKLRNDISFFNNFDKDANALLDKFPQNIRVISRMALIYRNSMIEEDKSRYEKSLKLYKKALDIANENGSSVKVQLTQNIGDLYVMSGQNSNGINSIKQAIDISQDNKQNISTNFALINAYIFMGDYLNAIKSIDNFLGSINEYGFTEEEKLQCSVGANYHKSIIYAHANQKKRAEKSVLEYKKSSDELINFYGWNINEVDGIVNRMGVRSGDKVRWSELTPYWQSRNEAWVNILIGNYKKAGEYLKSARETNRPSYDLDGILDIMQGNMNEGIDKLEKINSRYPLYFKAQAYKNSGRIDEATQLLDSIRFLPIQNLYNALVVKRSSDLYKQLTK